MPSIFLLPLIIAHSFIIRRMVLLEGPMFLARTVVGACGMRRGGGVLAVNAEAVQNLDGAISKFN
jgi:hypothetical protein